MLPPQPIHPPPLFPSYHIPFVPPHSHWQPQNFHQITHWPTLMYPTPYFLTSNDHPILPPVPE
ncbi:hypothetical protein FCV25MIE_16164, partial [Fagus crenata]